MNLSVIESTPALKESFIQFNKVLYNERQTAAIQAGYKWTLQEHPESIRHLIALSHDEIIGQIILYPVRCFYQSKINNCVFAYDYIVRPDYLNTGVGVKLLSKTIKSHIHFGIGVSDISKKLHLILKEKSIGDIYKFLFIKNAFSYVYAGVNTYLKITLRKLPGREKFDDSIHIEKLQAVKKNGLPQVVTAWNQDVIEFERSGQFDDLRFGSFANKYIHYHIYDSKKNLQGYFVLRREIWRGMRVLMVSDYRMAAKNEEVVDFICTASKILMKKNKMDAVLFGSSLQWLDKKLIQHHFKKVGLPSEIFTNLMLEEGWEKRVRDRNIIMATPADSDFEFNLGNELWKN